MFHQQATSSSSMTVQFFVEHFFTGFTLADYRFARSADAETFLAAACGRALARVLLDLHLPDKSGVMVL